MSDRDLLLIQLDRAYNRRSWHGTNLRGSIRGLSAQDVVWRPAPGRHNIQELVVHAAYWKYAVRRRLARERRGSFPLLGSDWFSRDVADETQWRGDVRLLDDMHRQLRAAIGSFDLKRATLLDRGETPLSLIAGIIAHDLYHAGQIQLLKRLSR
jgi:uncharacterized damage-inducible protein DinB